ncbi:MAG: hypothetical protein JWP06_829 [Candidatus Saccharibacteria bacterium]|nr:hypothetical protein [Candidatus Saccharibacteria bacterium]
MNFVSLFAQSYYYPQDVATPDSATSAGIAIFFFLFMFATIVISYAITSFLFSRIFKKAGVESWKAWVPVYSSWILLELGGQKGYWAVLALIPVVNIASVIFMFIAMYHIGLNFGKEGVFVLLAILLPIVWCIWLAFDNSIWKGPNPLKAQPAQAENNSDASVNPS